MNIWRMDEKGNALFLILIAVALFAALSYAITKTSRLGRPIENEQNFISASLLIQIMGRLQAGATRVTMSGAASPATLLLHAPGDQMAACTTGDDCLFAKEGGAIDVPSPPMGIFSAAPVVTYYETADGYSIEDIGTAAADVIVTFSPLTIIACRNINTGLKLGNAIPADANADTVLEGFPGQPSGCLEMAGVYTAYQSLAEQ